MAIAGKVAITLSTENGGAWSADVTYDRLVAVKHNNNLYISRKTVANVEPPNDEFWFLALEGFGGNDVQALIDRLNELSDLIQAIIDGTTPVGNSKTLDGHGAEYFGKSSEVTVRSDQRDKETDHTEYANKLVFVGLKINTSINLLNTGALYSYVFGLMGYGTTGGGNAHELAFNNSGIYHRQVLNDNSKTEWEKLFTTAGGTVESSSVIPFGLKHLGEYGQYIAFSNNLGKLGHLGVDANKKPYFKNAEETANYELLHTGNKPTGTYTGNGDASNFRMVATGGIGDGCIVRSSNGIAIVTGSCVSILSGNSAVTDNSATWQNGELGMFSNHAVLNASGVTYTYHVI